MDPNASRWLARMPPPSEVRGSPTAVWVLKATDLKSHNEARTWTQRLHATVLSNALYTVMPAGSGRSRITAAPNFKRHPPVDELTFPSHRSVQVEIGLGRPRGGNDLSEERHQRRNYQEEASATASTVHCSRRSLSGKKLSKLRSAQEPLGWRSRWLRHVLICRRDA
jgi:hypothetical protein